MTAPTQRYVELYNETGEYLGQMTAKLMGVVPDKVMDYVASRNLILTPAHTDHYDNVKPIFRKPKRVLTGTSRGIKVLLPEHIGRGDFLELLAGVKYEPEFDTSYTRQIPDQVPFSEVGRFSTGVKRFLELNGSYLPWGSIDWRDPTEVEAMNPLMFAMAADPRYRPVIAAAINHNVKKGLIKGWLDLPRNPHQNYIPIYQMSDFLTNAAPSLDIVKQVSGKDGLHETGGVIDEINRVHQLFINELGSRSRRLGI